MADRARNFVVRFLGDTKQLDKANKEAASSTEALSEKFDAAGEAIAAFYVFDKVAQFGRSAVKVASDVAEATNAASITYGEASDEVVRAAENAATAVGLSKREYLQLANTVGTFGRAAGKTGEDLQQFGEQLIKRAADVGSLRNAATGDVVEAFGAALRGEMEPIRQFGVLLDDATLRQKALEMGLVRTTKEALTPQVRTLAAYEAIMDQTSLAANDFTNTSDGLANSSKIARAELENVAGTLGESLLPVATKIVSTIAGVTGAFGDMNEGTQTAVLQLALAAGGGFAAVKAFLALKTAMDAFTVSTGIAAGALAPLLALVGGAGFLYVQYAREKGRATEATERFTEALKAEAAGQADAVLQEVARSIAAVSDEAKKLGLSSTELADVVMGKQVPAFEAIKERAEEWRVSGGAIVGTFGEQGKAASDLVARVDELSGSFGTAKDAVEKESAAQKIATQVASELGVETDSTTKSTEKSTTVTEDQTTAQTAAADAAKAHTEALDDLASAQDDMASAQEDVTDAERDLAKVRAEGPKKREAAERAYAQALRGAEDAARAVADAEEAVAKARREQDSGLTAANAELAVLDAEAAIQDAQDTLANATDPRERARANRDLIQAQLDLADAQQTATDVQSGYSAKVDEASQRLADARRAQEEQARSVRDAQRAIAEAVTEAADDEVAAVKRVEDAYEDLRKKVAEVWAAATAAASGAPSIAEQDKAAADWVGRERAAADAAAITPTGVSPSFINYSGAGGGAAPTVVNNNTFNLQGTDVTAPQVIEEMDRRSSAALRNVVR